MSRRDSLAHGRRASYGALTARWTELCGRHLPVAVRGSVWRYSREGLPGDPEQGWKLHVSATILTAGRVLEAVAPLLAARGVLYKAPASLTELEKLNAGIFYGYSQVGKFLTIYPRTDGEAVRLAAELDRATRGLHAPSVPFDLKYRAGGCVYYRYGGFRALDYEGADGESVHAVRDPDGNLVPDVRGGAAHPEWAADPFRAAGRARRAPGPKVTPLQTTVRAFRALTQRGRGGVYRALDLGATPPRLCVLKEGRRDGEVGWDGRDGRWRVRHERRVLEALAAAGLDVPRVYGSFRAEGNCYLSIELIEGESFDRWLTRRRRRLSLAAALRRGAEMSRLVARVHEAGWVWRDCKPGNVIVTRGGELRPLDFEGACPVGRPDPLPWGTHPYAPPEYRDEFRGQSRLPEDLYALGATVYLLLAGRLPDESAPVPLAKVRRNVPARALRVVERLLDRDPRRRPDAASAARELESALDSLKGARSGREVDAAHEVREPRVGADAVVDGLGR